MRALADWLHAADYCVRTAADDELTVTIYPSCLIY
jgi:hypothetical protein